MPTPASPTPPASRLAQRLAAWPLLAWTDILRMALHDLERHPGRTVLTMLGLVIGSAAVVAVASVGLAGRDYAIQQLDTLGTNFMWVSYHGPSEESAAPVSARSRGLTESDFQAIQEQASALLAVTRVVVLYSTVSQGGRAYPISLVGTDGDFARVRNLTLTEGRALTESDVRDRRKVCVLLQSLADKLYGQQAALHRSLRIEDFDFEVVGVFRDIHTPGVETEITRDAVLIPISVARFFASDTSLDTIYAQARSRDLVDAATAQIRQILARDHGRSDLYTVGNLSYFIRVVNRISATLMVVVILLGIIALLVGGVGILNIMLISVSERTREIGIRVAIGARRREILRLFFLEALVISLTGGVIGILLGSLGPMLVHAVFDFPMPVSPLSIVIALIVSAAVGLTFGIVPAMRAARLDPVNALRYE
jgi:putative ABC transport system permease protein